MVCDDDNDTDEVYICIIYTFILKIEIKEKKILLKSVVAYPSLVASILDKRTTHIILTKCLRARYRKTKECDTK